MHEKWFHESAEFVKGKVSFLAAVSRKSFEAFSSGQGWLSNLVIGKFSSLLILSVGKPKCPPLQSADW